ncbi:MAG: hypothetical protein C5B52_07785 [Bacteroidetes bacterium]|nr:MAG: hypothetical protein C5B52_07785 [Bacteroidota bacterium]
METKLIYQDEAGLFQAFRSGEEQALTSIFHQLYPSLCYFGFTITGNQLVAEEIAEDAFVKIWQRRNIFEKLRQLKSYLYSTVHNDALNWIKKNKNRLEKDQNYSRQLQFSEANKLELIIESETFRQIFTALDKLPPQCRKVITMIFLEGKKVRQVAEELKVSQGTVKTHKARGILLLKKQIPTLLMLYSLLI